MYRGEWAKQLLTALGNEKPTQQTVNFVASWTLAENTKATYNPLATTQPFEGSTCFNSVCVRNYPSNGAGIEATVKTLTNGRYPHILNGLRQNRPEESANGSELGVWGTGLRAVVLWRTGDHTGEILKSHPTTNKSEKEQHTPIERPGPVEDKPTIGSMMTSGDQEQFARDIQYITLGGLLMAIAIVLAIKSYVPTQQILKTAAIAATA
jgi:hypothetical protein